MSAVVWSVENHTGTSIVAVDDKGLVTVHPSSLSQGQLAAMGLSPDVPVATVTATITVDRTRKISASYDVYQGITPQGIAELIDAMPTPSQVDAENKDTVLFISRAMGQLSSADEQYLTGTLLTSAKKQKLEYAQAGVKKLNQTLIKTYAMDY
ncbi:hypothetical protein [Eubacterium aggregans]|uniref:hypothetical protein n=1 Tax=Eubacterium aggregans TaxID=81409 RepID=UPI003F3D19C7